MTIEQLSGLPIIGNTLQLRDMPRFLERVNQLDAEFVKTKIGKYNVYFTKDYNIAKSILTAGDHTFKKGPTLRKFARPILGEGPITASDKKSKKQREILSDFFTTSQDDYYIGLFLKESEKYITKWEKNDHIDLSEELFALTLEILGKSLLGIGFESELGNIKNATTHLYKYILGGIQNPFITNINLPFGRFKSAKDSLAYFEKILERPFDGEKGKSIISKLSALDVSSKERRDIIMNLFFAGHETTAACIFWTIYLLLKNEDVLEELKNEINNVSEDDISSYIREKESLLARTIYESMRIYPPVHSVGRELVKDYELNNEEFKKGDLFLISNYLMGKNESIFKDADEFNPKRINSTKEVNFLPFSIGPRICIGKKFSLLQISSILYTILKNTKIEAINFQEIQPLFYITLTPDKELKLKIDSRT